MVLTNGDYRLMVGQGLCTGDAKRFKTFDEVMDAFRRQLEHNVKMAADAVNAKDTIYRAEFPAPFVSASPPI